MTSTTTDLYKLHKDEYVAPKTPVLVETKPGTYLTITGQGEPGGEVFTTKLGALYGVAYTLKMAQKSAGNDYKVAKLEGLWWGSGGKLDFSGEPPSQWNWKLLIRTPAFITQRDLREATATLLKKKKGSEVRQVTLESIDEGLCVQMLHVGSYADEGRTIAAMRDLAHEKGLSFHGVHHEIYLSDPRRVPEERLRTILRIPVR